MPGLLKADYVGAEEGSMWLDELREAVEAHQFLLERHEDLRDELEFVEREMDRVRMFLNARSRLPPHATHLDNTSSSSSSSSSSEEDDDDTDVEIAAVTGHRGQENQSRRRAGPSRHRHNIHPQTGQVNILNLEDGDVENLQRNVLRINLSDGEEDNVSALSQQAHHGDSPQPLPQHQQQNQGDNQDDDGTETIVQVAYRHPRPHTSRGTLRHRRRLPPVEHGQLTATTHSYR